TKLQRVSTSSLVGWGHALKELCKRHAESSPGQVIGLPLDDFGSAHCNRSLTQRLPICDMAKALDPLEQFLTAFQLAVARVLLHFNPVTRRLFCDLVRGIFTLADTHPPSPSQRWSKRSRPSPSTQSRYRILDRFRPKQTCDASLMGGYYEQN